MVGDSLHTDIKGAVDIGIDGLFLLSGVHKDLEIDGDSFQQQIE